jgi:hypothetical protein
MHRNLAFILSLLAFASCGAPAAEPASVSPEFGDYYQGFLSEAGRFGSTLVSESVKVSFGAFEEETDLGECAPGGEVSINEARWSRLAHYDRELLIFHELGHCLLGQKHRAGSLMDPRLSGSQYAFRREAYLKELFGH